MGRRAAVGAVNTYRMRLVCQNLGGVVLLCLLYLLPESLEGRGLKAQGTTVQLEGEACVAEPVCLSSVDKTFMVKVAVRGSPHIAGILGSPGKASCRILSLETVQAFRNLATEAGQREAYLKAVLAAEAIPAQGEESLPARADNDTDSSCGSGVQDGVAVGCNFVGDGRDVAVAVVWQADASGEADGATFATLPAVAGLAALRVLDAYVTAEDQLGEPQVRPVLCSFPLSRVFPYCFVVSLLSLVL